MAQGQKYNDDIKERAFALLASNNNAQYVAKTLGIPYTTVKTWEKKWLEQSQVSKGEGTTNADEDSLVELRKKKKEEFVSKAWKLIDDSIAVAQKRIARELAFEDNVDIVAEALKKNAKEIEKATGVGWFELLNLIDKLKTLKNFKLSELSTLIGTIYDKQALANKEATSIVDNNVTIKFEDL